MLPLALKGSIIFLKTFLKKTGKIGNGYSDSEAEQMCIDSC